MSRAVTFAPGEILLDRGGESTVRDQAFGEAIRVVMDEGIRGPHGRPHGAGEFRRDAEVSLGAGIGTIAEDFVTDPPGECNRQVRLEIRPSTRHRGSIDRRRPADRVTTDDRESLHRNAQRESDDGICRLVNSDAPDLCRRSPVVGQDGVEKVLESECTAVDFGVPPRILDPCDDLCARRRTDQFDHRTDLFSVQLRSTVLLEHADQVLALGDNHRDRPMMRPGRIIAGSI